MNLLFIGPYRQKDGWGYATRDYLKSLKTNPQLNITAQPLYLGDVDYNFDDEVISELENKKYDHYDMVIQKALPECFYVNKNFKYNIGMTELETNSFIGSQVVNCINRLDQLWVPSHQEKNTLINSGVNIPIKAVSQPMNTEYIKSLSEYKLQLSPILNNMFKFYFVGDYCDRKNLSDLIKAFHLAFSYEERVALIIKTSKYGVSSSQLRQVLEKEFEGIKKSLNISSKYKKEIIITESLSYKDLIGLHNACDCMVMPSYGEAFCRPVAEALVCGSTPIVTTNTGMTDYINDSNGFLIESTPTSVITENKNLNSNFDMYTAKETWSKPHLLSLIDKMRKVFDLHKSKSEKLKDKQENGKSSIDIFSYEAIGKKLCI